MRIRLGLHLDGERGESLASHLDAITCGPLGMVTILETQLGLLRSEVSHADRVVQYRDALRCLDAPQRFYAASFAADELGTAATLLRWRDQWFLNGWSGEL